MNVNINYADMTLPLQGPENPFADRGRFMNQNALAGHVEEQMMSDHAFRQQHMTHTILGYSANPSIDPNAPAVLGSLEKAQANGFATIGSVKAPKAQKKELKRKRKTKGDLEIVDGEGAYEGPWARWAGVRRIFHWDVTSGRWAVLKVGGAGEFYETRADERLGSGAVSAYV